MTKQQRRYHRYIWAVYAFLLPAGILFGWLAIPNSRPVTLLSTGKPEQLPLVVRSVSNPEYTVELRADETKTKWQLVWKNKKVMTVPSAVIYDVTTTGDDPARATLIGRIESKGDYIFDLPAGTTGYAGLRLLLFDFIHERKLNTINL
ncbi:MAG: hypothetical protein U0U70_12375 [Chitinophagaceae bacterium]